MVTAMEKYLRSTEIIDCDAKSIREKAQDLTKGLRADKEKAVALYYFVRDGIKHNAYAPLMVRQRFKASATLEAGNGFCQQKAILLVALARAVGIPARLGFVDIRDYLISPSFREMVGGIDRFPVHGYAELFINGRWVHASPAYDMETCRRKRFTPVDFDGEKDAKDSTHNLDGKLHIEHIKYHGPYEDFPWDEIQNYYKQWVTQLGFDWKDFMGAAEQVRLSKSGE